MFTSSRDSAPVGIHAKLIKRGVLAAVVAGLSICCGSVMSQPQPASGIKGKAVQPVTSAAATVPAMKETPVKLVPLANLSAHVGPLRLTRTNGAESLSIPVSRREVLKSAVLHLVLTNSIALDERSQLVVRLNNRAVAQLQLSARQPELTADIRLPLELLQPGYNQLNFSVAQHSQTAQCEDTNAPELWTEIDTTASVLRLQTETRPMTAQQLQLSSLNDLFDPKQQTLPKVNIVTAGHPESDAALRMGGMLAQGVALKMRYVMPTISQVDAQTGNSDSRVAPGLALGALTGADNILVGSIASLKPYLAPALLQQIKGSFLGLYAMPDGQHIMLVVSGRDDAEVQRAAEVFAWQRLAFPQLSQWNISAFSAPVIPVNAPQANVAGEGRYSFEQLGFRTAAVTQSSPAELHINLPPDVYAQEDAQMAFHLNFSQGAKLNSEVTINLYLNDVFQRAIVIDERQGGYFDNYRLSLPLNNFKPGNNVLSFRPEVVAHTPCAPSGSLQMTLFDSSSVNVPYIYHFTELPDLGRFASNAFPYLASSDGSKLSVQLTNHDSAAIAAGWTLLGKLAQQQSVPLSAAQLTFGHPAAGRHMLVVGTVGSVPAELLSDAPWKLDGDITIAGASIQVAHPTRESGWFRQQFQSLTDTSQYNMQADHLNTLVRGDARLGQQLLVMQFRSKKDDDVTATVFMAADAAQLQDGMRQLMAPQYWNSMAGDVTLLTLGKTEVATQRIGPTYDEGHIGKTEYLGYIASKYPWILYGITLIVLALLTLLCWRALRRHLRGRTHGVDV
jgi:cellulose synthase operon protein B